VALRTCTCHGVRRLTRAQPSNTAFCILSIYHVRITQQVRQKQAFRQRIEAAREQIRARRSELVELRGGYDSDDEQHYFIENKTREVVVSVKTEVV
jgi:hypothetical protein